jgi:tetratricopeptide (TPR) repeat protein/tRNA A-37 threonylcarbamoyl transferase component Bud32
VQWQAVHDVFVAALDLPQDEREAFVARESQDHPDVEHEVWRLLRLHDAASGFLETSTVSTDDFEEPVHLTEGELIAERFVVLRLLGRGGMSEVYEARDSVLGERVALKVMRSASRDPVRRMDQFRQEVQLARRVTHPGVCRVHDVAFHRGRDGQPLLVLTMELLGGETLAERLRRGVLPASEARSIVLDVATALEAAHRRGIVHGDIKPENVMLVPRQGQPPRVVLTDFGLARALTGSGPSSLASALMGTPAYMAPERLGGAPPSIASDVYAFALLTYRLWSPQDDLWRPTSVDAGRRGVAPKLPPGLGAFDVRRQHVFARALSVDPVARYPSALGFAQALFQRPSAWKSLALGGGLALLTIALLPAWRLERGDADASRPPALLLLTTVDNRTGESELDGLTELLRGQLAVVAPDTIPGVLREMRQDPTAASDPGSIREVALRQRASLVLFPRVTRADAGYAIDLRLEQLGARPSIVEREWHQTLEASDRPQLLDVVRRATLWVRATTGESKSQLAEQDRLPAEITTASWDALRLFAGAERSSAEGDLPKAVVFLQEAVRLDPEFVSAYVRLGDIFESLRRENDAYQAWRRAIELANRRQLTTREALRLRGQFLDETGSLSDAEEAFRAYALHYPLDFTAVVSLGTAIAAQGRIAESIPWFQSAVRLRPTSPSAQVFRPPDRAQAGGRGRGGRATASRVGTT